MKRFFLLSCLLVVGAVAACQPPPPAPAAGVGSAASTAPVAHAFRQIADGVYAAIGTGVVNVGSNTAVIVNDDDVLIVDSHITPAAARALVQDIATLTDKPVRFVVDTHFHFDHAHGNQVFGPEVQIIGHEFTRQELAAGRSLQGSYVNFTSGVPQQIESLRQQMEGETHPEARAKLDAQYTMMTAYAEALKEITPVPPNVTLRSVMTLHRGGREIQLHHFGRGHTAGDVVVFLPGERVVATGDLLTASLAYMGDAFAGEWPATLEALKQLDFEWVIPGHGEPYQGKAQLENFQAYLRDFWEQVSALHAKGVSVEDAASRIDMTKHKGNYPQIQGVGVDVIPVRRAYEVLGS